MTDNDIKKIADAVCEKLTKDQGFLKAVRSAIVGYCWGTTGKTKNHLRDRERSNLYNRWADTYDNAKATRGIVEEILAKLK